MIKIIANILCCSMVVLCDYTPGRAQVQLADQDEVNPAAVRPFWLGGTALQAAAAPYTLTEQERNKFNGTFVPLHI